MVSLPNVSEKDVKGLLFRKRQRISCRCASAPPAPESARSPRRIFENANFQFLCKAFQTLSSAYRTQVKDVRGYCPGSSRPHTPPTYGAKVVELSPAFLRANVCELSHTFLRAMRASPHLHLKGEETGDFVNKLNKK